MTIVRIDLESRRVDTVGAVKIPRNRMTMSGTPETGMRMSNIQNPLQYVDDWAVTADGRIAIVRGQEYKIEWIDADGKVESSSKLPFAWRHLNDSVKVAFLDSTKTAMEKMREQAMQRMQQQGGAAGGPVVMGPGGAADMGMGDRVRVAEFSVRAGAEMGGRGVAPGAAANAPGRGANQTFQIPPIELVQPNELPDYAPPFTGGAVRGDADGNVWIRTTLAYNGGAVYDVVNSKGQLTDRVLVPTGRFIAGFGPGVVYMGFRDGAGVRLEAAAVREGSTIAAKQ
jgi:hypothetical protein